MKKMVVGGLLLVFISMPFIISCGAQGPAQEEELPVNFDATYAEVVAVNADEGTITLESYDYQQEKEMKVTYRVKEDVELDNAESLDDIKTGDWVDVEFHVDGEGNRVADFIGVEVEPILEEEMAE